MSDTSYLLRLNKALAQAGAASRRGADELIKSGRVSVNGSVVSEPGTMVDPAKDSLELDGRPLAPQAAASPQVYVLLNKPIQTVSTAKDPQGRPTIFDILPGSLKKRRLFSVGRLDYFSEGLLLLTTDGELANRLGHPSFNHVKVYEVKVRGELTPEKLKIMRQGMTLAEGEKLAPVEVRQLGKPEYGRAWLEMRLTQGVNRQIRRMCRDLDLVILNLKRMSQGPLKLGSLAKGQTRELTPEEVKALRQAVGLA